MVFVVEELYTKWECRRVMGLVEPDFGSSGEYLSFDVYGGKRRCAELVYRVFSPSHALAIANLTRAPNPRWLIRGTVFILTVGRWCMNNAELSPAGITAGLYLRLRWEDCLAIGYIISEAEVSNRQLIASQYLAYFRNGNHSASPLPISLLF
jgi:hypothetical protein